MTKICEQCGNEYVPNDHAVKTQKYCSKSCKEKMAWLRFKSTGDIRGRKGGYNRSVYIKLWMQARQSDNTAPCHYCGTRLRPDNFVLDHKVPISILSTREAMQNPDNLVVCCTKCNIEKSAKYGYEEFLAMKKETHG